MDKTSVKSPPPGPNAKKLIADDERFLVTTTKTAPIAVSHAQGVHVHGVDGEVFLDFTAGVGVNSTGHAHPRVVKAIAEQAAKFIHFAGTDYYYAVQVELARRLTEITPGLVAKKVFYTQSGTESNEAAIKIARHKSHRKQILAFYGAFHGRTAGSLSLTASKIVHKERFFPTMPGVTHVPFANPYRNPWGIDGYAEPDRLVDATLRYIQDYVFENAVPANEVAALFVEPVQGEGGYIVPPKTFLPRLHELCRENGILLVADEVQSGIGRTGKMFASEHFGVEPDIVSIAKGIASGMPLGACIARSDLDFDRAGAHSNTFGGNPVSCAAAMATLDVIRDEKLVENAATLGKHLSKRLAGFKERHDLVGDARGLGLMQAIDLVKDRKTKEHAVKERAAVIEAAYKRGLLVLPCGKSSVRLIPPLIIDREQLDEGLDILDECLKTIAR
ncbi:MAG: acetyl ornithine aminotransferase family protein [Euryarchaeota archaeon]|nr:acetyl ornithine aminotransferase family protein [Euryarchaeota archaeon]